MLINGLITCMLMAPVYVFGKAAIGKDTVCGINEEFRLNSGGLNFNTKSSLSCHPRYGIMEEDTSYTHISGCFCKDGHYVDDNNKCQPLSACKSEKLIDFNPKCEEKEEYLTSKCNRFRLERCAFNSDGKRFFEQNHSRCLPPGCFCKHGYYLDENNKCVLPTDCPPYPEKYARMSKYNPYDREDSTESNNSTMA